ncbi:hypothetical protein PILCRDRAFT_810935 [Piloderma croceum F 1598]|uniref:Uncharacterized protein n=1 Tax=Piloderma croceum (strain F 1598) TaxID=765440 RepID=A0A0C3GJ45_PILCF|nr:hypothetical protein PILCRDRAFT_810935 [Piloderma croceum F 1598]
MANIIRQLRWFFCLDASTSYAIILDFKKEPRIVGEDLSYAVRSTVSLGLSHTYI